MERITFIRHQGKSILLEDFSNLRPGPEMLAAFKTAHETIAAQPHRSVLALFDATGATYNAEALSALKDFVQSNTPFIKSVAVVGITGLLNVAITTITRVANRPFRTFPTRQAALDFLAEQ